MSKIRLYKYVTPPKEAEGAEMTLKGGKSLRTTGFIPTVKAVNSLGATVNSIGIALLKGQAAQQKLMDEQRRAAALQMDRQREAAIEAKEDTGNAAISATKSAGLGFMDYLMKFLKNLLIFGALDFLSKKENREKIVAAFKMISSFFKWVGDTVKWWGEKYEELFGEDSDGWTRFKAAAQMIGAGVAVLAGISFLKNPIGTVKAFASIISTVGKGILNLGKFLGGNALGQMALAGAQGVAAFNDVANNYEGVEEDRMAAARGAGIGAAGGGMALGMIGNQIAGPIGGLLGNAVGGLLGKEAGKFLGPIVGNFFNTIKKGFDVLMEAMDRFFKPLRDSITELFKAMGPPLQMIVDAIKPHLPKLMSFAELMGKVVFFPLIKMLEGVTFFLKMIPGVKERMDTAMKNTNTENTNQPQELSTGGKIQPKTAVLPEFSKGGWITGPQEGYPVSMDGGKSVSFIGHGTEYVAQRSAGGFVVPFDTPHTRKNPNLTSQRIRQATAAGYKVPGHSDGGTINHNYTNIQPTVSTNLPPANYGKYKGYSFGGFLNRVASTAATATLPPQAQVAMNFIKPHLNRATEAAGGIVRHIAEVMPPELKERTGKIINKTVQSIKTIATQVQTDDVNASIATMVADAIVLPTEKNNVQGANGEAIVQDSKPNPATDFLTSRFGRSAEATSVLSNLF